MRKRPPRVTAHTHTTMNTPRILATSIAAAAALLLLAPSLHAADRFWIDPAGGPFADIANWSATAGGAGGATVPGAADVANFTLNSTYTVTFGAAVTLNALDAENGNVTLDLGGFTHTLTSGAASFIGEVAGQTGRLTLRDGTLAVDTSGDNVIIGHTAGSTGFLTVTTGGILGTAALRPDLVIGDVGTGTLAVNDNGQVFGNLVVVGAFSGSAGTVTITGPNAVMSDTGITVGDSGTGTVTVSNGGTLTTTGNALLAADLGTDGTVTVSGAGSSWSVFATTIGSAGDGTLTVSSGGLVTSTGTVTLGNFATGVGTATVSGAGSRWNLTQTQNIGNNGLGVMTVSNGGQVVSNSLAFVGGTAGSEGRATVTGVGSRWKLGNAITVGFSGTGEVTVSAGGEVSASSLILGNNASGIGEVNITGTGSKLTTSGAVTVASLGTGTLSVSSGGELNVGNSLTVGDPAGTPLGTLNLDGGAIFVAGDFTNSGILNFTDGLLRVKGNFQTGAAANPLIINGADSDDVPTLELIGAGSTTNVTTLSVGTSRRGQLLLREGRFLDLGANAVAIGALVGGEGTLIVQSGAQLLTTGSLSIGGNGASVGGKGRLDVAGGTVDAGALRLFRDGTLNLSSGTLAVDIAPVLDGQFNWTGGTLRFDTATALTSTNAPKFLGLDATLDAGQALTSTATLTLQTPLTVDGGSLAASALINQSRLEIRSGSIGPVQNDSLLLGNGVISGAVTNNAAGRIRADSGKTLAFTGAFAANAGQLTLQGGTLDFSSAITNSATGFISGRGSLYTPGLTNNGAMAFSGGTMDIYGDVTNAAGGRIVTSGAGATTTFFDDLVHNGTEIFTGANASTVIFGASTGAGPFTGTGTVYSIGDLRPGNSPATVTYGGGLVLGTSTTLTMELGGTIEGTQYDSLHVANSFAADGILALSLINGFAPALGNTFDLLDFASITGTFDSFMLPALAQYLAWNTSALYTTGEVSVTTTLTPIEQWRLLHFGSPANSGDGADDNDFDKDGARNLLEYALGLDPLVPSTSGLPGLSVVTAGANSHIALTVKRPLSATDITYQIEVGGALVAFLPGSLYSSGGDVPSNANTTQVSRTPDGSGNETLVIRDNTPLAGTPSRFMRLKVSRP